MIFSIAPAEFDSFLPPSSKRDEKREWLFGEVAVPVTKGEVLLVSEDVDLALSLRQYLLACSVGLNWVSNFWLALSVMSQHRFCSLVVDMRASSVTERFVVDFAEEYKEQSKGKRVFLTSKNTQPNIRQGLRKRGCIVLEDRFTIEDVAEELNFEPK
jgi:hypothetical protein